MCLTLCICRVSTNRNDCASKKLAAQTRLHSSWYWFVRRIPQQETGQGHHKFTVSPSSGGHLFRRIPSPASLSWLLWQVNHTPVSSLFCSAELWPCRRCQIRAEARLRVRSPPLARNQPEKNPAVYQSILPLLSYWYGLYLGRRLPQGEGWVCGGSRPDRWWSMGDVSNGSKVRGINNGIKAEKNKRALLRLRVEIRI